MDGGSVDGGPKRRDICICKAAQQELTQHCKAYTPVKLKKNNNIECDFTRGWENHVQKQH